MASPVDERGRDNRRVSRGRKAPRSISMEIPDRFRYGEDAQDDVSAPKPIATQYMGQSVFTLMAAAGSKPDFHSRFEEEYSGLSSDLGDEGSDNVVDEKSKRKRLRSRRRGRPGKQREPLSDAKLLKSLPMLRAKGGKKKDTEERHDHETSPSSPVEDHPFGALAKDTAFGDTPVLSRMLRAEEKLNVQMGEQSTAPSDAGSPVVLPEQKGSLTLSRRLMDIFGFELPEDVHSGNPVRFDITYTLIDLKQSIPVAF